MRFQQIDAMSDSIDLNEKQKLNAKQEERGKAEKRGEPGKTRPHADGQSGQRSREMPRRNSLPPHHVPHPQAQLARQIRSLTQSRKKGAKQRREKSASIRGGAKSVAYM
jgi:hypothetical protein